MAKKTKSTKSTKPSTARTGTKTGAKMKVKTAKATKAPSKKVLKPAKKAIKVVAKTATKTPLKKTAAKPTKLQVSAKVVVVKSTVKVALKSGPKDSAAKKPAAKTPIVVETKTVEIPKNKATKTQKIVAHLAPEPVQQEVILTNADGLRYCKVAECDELSTSDGYCRYHYLAHWKRIQLRKRILAGDKLDRYIEELTARYPDKYLEMIRKDLASEKDFATAIQELEIDGSGEEGEFEDEARSYIDEVRGVTTGESTGSSSDEDF